MPFWINVNRLDARYHVRHNDGVTTVHLPSGSYTTKRGFCDRDLSLDDIASLIKAGIPFSVYPPKGEEPPEIQQASDGSLYVTITLWAPSAQKMVEAVERIAALAREIGGEIDPAPSLAAVVQAVKNKKVVGGEQ